jgi:hypothetical protein
MKTLLRLSIALAVFGTSCKSGMNTASNATNDDVYYSTKDAPESRPVRPNGSATNVDQQRVDMSSNNSYNSSAPAPANNTTQSNDQYASNNTNYDDSYNSDDYYDYEYAARIKRFHNPAGDFGYYDDPYTNSYYYSGNPWTYGTSIYMGYPFWGPTYNMYMYEPSYMWGYSPGFYNPWYSYPHYGFGIGFGYGCGFGYNPWYMGGMGYNGYGGYGYYTPYYANAYDANSVYHGPRGSANSTGRGGSVNNSFAHRTIGNGVLASGGPNPHVVTAGGPRGAVNTPANNGGLVNSNRNVSTNVYGKNTTGGTHFESKPVFENLSNRNEVRGSENIRNNNVPMERGNTSSHYNNPNANPNGNYNSGGRNNPRDNGSNNGYSRPNGNYNEPRPSGGNNHYEPSHQSAPTRMPSGGGGAPHFNQGGGGGAPRSNPGGGGGFHGGGGGGSHSSGGGGGHGGRR